MSKRKLTPADFLKKLTIKELVEIRRDERKASLMDAIIQQFIWGMRLQSRGINTNVLNDPDFDPVMRFFGFGLRAPDPADRAMNAPSEILGESIPKRPLLGFEFIE